MRILRHSVTRENVYFRQRSRIFSLSLRRRLGREKKKKSSDVGKVTRGSATAKRYDIRHRLSSRTVSTHNCLPPSSRTFVVSLLEALCFSTLFLAPRSFPQVSSHYYIPSSIGRRVSFAQFSPDGLCFTARRIAGC